MSAKLFCSYSHRDRELKKQLEAHLSPLRIAGRLSAYWSDDELTAGTEFDPLIRTNLEAANIIVLLISSDYLGSNYCWNIETRLARELHAIGRARIVPILLRSVFWQRTDLSKFTLIPRNLTPVTAWPDRDAAWAEVVGELDRVIDEVDLEQRIRADPQLTSALANTEPLSSQTVSSDTFRCALQCEPTVVRGAGLTELIGDIVLQFRGDPGSQRFADIELFFNVNLTSRVLQHEATEVTLSPATGYCLTKMPTLGRSFNGVRTGVNAMKFLSVPLHELRLLPEQERNLRLANVRVNAGQLGVPGGHSSYVVAYVHVTDTSVHPSPLVTVAEVSRGLRYEVQSLLGEGGLIVLSQAHSLNTALFTREATADQVSFLIKAEGRLAGYESLPGHRARLLIRFSNVPVGVRLYATNDHFTNNSPSVSATLISTAPNGEGVFKPRPVDGHTQFEGVSVALSELDVSGGEAIAVWEMGDSSMSAQQQLAVGFVLAYEAQPWRNMPSLGTFAVSATLGPISTVTTASPSAPIPRFADTSRMMPIANIVR